MDYGDIHTYNIAVSALKQEPVQGPSGMYHVKNGIIHHGYTIVGTEGFSTSSHYWNIFH